MNILVVLVPGFSHLSLGAVIEPLATLAALHPETGLSITIGSIEDHAVPSSSGLCVQAEVTLEECLRRLSGPARADAMVLCCGLRTPFRAQGDIRKVLRSAHHAGVPILGTGCAAWKMADAGVLSAGSGTVHWTTLPAFAERHHDIAAHDALYVTSDHATSTPGEAAALDMMIAFIRQNFSAAMAERVATHLMIGYPRAGDLHQPRERSEMPRDAPERLRAMVDRMAGALETPLRIADIAREAGLSRRQAERLFAAHLGRSPKAHYLRLRLRHGRLLIEQTSMSILEISLACGFSNRRDFTRYFREAYGHPPTQTRRLF